MQQRHVTLDAVEITVLDEADHMADLGFLPVVTRIMDKTPQGGQRLLFSATLDNGVDKLVKKYLRNEVMHSVDEVNSHVAAMTHHVFEVDADGKKDLVQRLASGKGRRILFMRTKHTAKKLAKQLTDAGIPSVDLHGNLSQIQRDRNLAAFQAGTSRVLVATDVAARGVHVDDVELVVHVDPPSEHKAYLHRSGRTARAGSEGDVVTVMMPAQRKDTETLLRKAAIKVTPQRVTASSAAVAELVGDVAAYVKPLPRVEQPQRGRSQGGRSQGANAQRKRANRDGRGQGQPRVGRPSTASRGTTARGGPPHPGARPPLAPSRRRRCAPTLPPTLRAPARVRAAPAPRRVSRSSWSARSCARTAATAAPAAASPSALSSRAKRAKTARLDHRSSVGWVGFVIRPATVGDAAAIAGLNVALGQDADGGEGCAEQCAAAALHVGGHRLGCCLGGPHPGDLERVLPRLAGAGHRHHVGERDGVLAGVHVHARPGHGKYSATENGTGFAGRSGNAIGPRSFSRCRNSASRSVSP